MYAAPLSAVDSQTCGVLLVRSAASLSSPHRSWLIWHLEAMDGAEKHNNSVGRAGLASWQRAVPHREVRDCGRQVLLDTGQGFSAGRAHSFCSSILDHFRDPCRLCCSQHSAWAHHAKRDLASNSLTNQGDYVSAVVVEAFEA